jgi:DNA primase
MDERYVLDRVRQAAAAVQPKRAATGRYPNSETATDAGPQRSGNLRPGQNGRSQDRADPVHRVEREALKLAVQWSGLTGPEFDALGATAFTLPAHAAVFELIAGCGGVATAGRARDWAAALLEAAPDDVVRGFVTELAVEPLELEKEPDERYADVVLARVGELAAGRQIAGIKARLQRMNPEEDQAAYNKMFGDLVGLEQRRKWLLDRASGA